MSSGLGRREKKRRPTDTKGGQERWAVWAALPVAVAAAAGLRRRRRPAGVGERVDEQGPGFGARLIRERIQRVHNSFLNTRLLPFHAPSNEKRRDSARARDTHKRLTPLFSRRVRPESPQPAFCPSAPSPLGGLLEPCTTGQHSTLQFSLNTAPLGRAHRKTGGRRPPPLPPSCLRLILPATTPRSRPSRGLGRCTWCCSRCI